MLKMLLVWLIGMLGYLHQVATLYSSISLLSMLLYSQTWPKLT
jgi:hypothetical protein